MPRWMLLVPILVLAGAGWQPRQEVPPVQTGQFVHSEVADWLPGTFTGVYVEGGDLRLQDGQAVGAFESQPLQTPFGLNAAIAQWHATATAGQTVTLELRSSVDGQTWTDWQAAMARPNPAGGAISQLYILRPFSSWLQYRARLETTSGSPTLADVTLTYLSSTAGPALIDMIGRVPPTGPLVKTPPPQTVAARDWGAVDPQADIERQRPGRIIISEIQAPADDPNSAATIRAAQWVANNLQRQDILPYHFLVDGAGTIYQGPRSPTAKLAEAPEGAVQIAVLADTQREGLSEAAQSTLAGLLGWLGDAYWIAPARVEVAQGAPARLAELAPEIRAAMDRAIVRARLFFAAGNTALGSERLALLNPSGVEARATLTGISSLGQERRSITVPAGERVDLLLNSTFAVTGPLALDLTADRPLLAERVQIVGRELYGGPALSELARAWYFGDASGLEDDPSSLELLNPHKREVQMVVTLYPDSADPVSRTLTLAPRSQQSLYLQRTLAGQRFALKVVANEPIAAERVDLSTAGAASVTRGIAALSQRWLFAEGSSMAGYTTTLALLNPWPQRVAVTLRVLSEDGTSLERRYAIAGLRQTVLTLNDVVPDLPFAMELAAERPIAAERTIRFDNGAGATATPGAARPATRWVFVEGSTATPAEEYLLVLNPNTQPVEVEVLYHLGDGRTERRSHTAGGGARLTIAVNADVPNQPILSATVVADRPVVVERTIYTNGATGRGGETSLGIAGD